MQALHLKGQCVSQNVPQSSPNGVDIPKDKVNRISDLTGDGLDGKPTSQLDVVKQSASPPELKYPKDEALAAR